MEFLGVFWIFLTNVITSLNVLPIR